MNLGPIDARIAELAADQHGVVASRQLSAIGVTPDSTRRRVESGRLHRVHRGVFAVGHPRLSRRGIWFAAVLACGEGAVLWGRSAAALWGLETHLFPVEVRTPRGSHSRPGIRVSRRPDQLPEDVTTHHGIPCTTPARTLIDRAAAASRRQTERLLDTALARRHLDLVDLGEALARHPTHRGARRIQKILASHDPGSTLTVNGLEEDLIAICDRHSIPRPIMNQPMALPDGTPIRPDAIWHRERLIVELDGRATHTTPAAFERDRHRDAQAQLAGYAVLRFTSRQVEHDPDDVGRTIATMLARRSARPGQGTHQGRPQGPSHLPP